MDKKIDALNNQTLNYGPIESFDQDLLDLHTFADRLESFIRVEHLFVGDGLVLGLNAPFGHGKTTFLNMWEDRLKKRRKADPNEGDVSTPTPMVIRVNAWQSDYLSDPLCAIVSKIIEELKEEGHNNGQVNEISKAFKKMGWFGLAIGGQIVQKVTGINAIEAGEVAEKRVQSGNDENQESNPFDVFQARQRAMGELKAALSDAFQGKEPTVYILVDELDRCRPDYAITFLETIKHIFDIRGLVFVLAVDRDHLEVSAKAAFGRGLNFDEYYRKFLQREVNLPKMSDKGNKRMIDQFIDKYVKVIDRRVCCADIKEAMNDGLYGFLHHASLTPRQLTEMFRILGHILARNREESMWMLHNIAQVTVIMSALRFVNSTWYEGLANGGLSEDDVIGAVKKYFDEDIQNEWLTFFFGGYCLVVDQKADYAGFMGKAGEEIGDPPAGGWSSHLRSSGQWGRSYINWFSRVRHCIEELEQMSA